jgi:molybdopterin molybdotransferase
MSAHRRPHDHESAEGLISVEGALDRVLSTVQVLPPVELPLRETYACVLSRDVVASADLPPFPSSAMDGFAVRSSDVESATADRSVPLSIAGEVAMGERPEVEVRAGVAVRIPTGGVVPDGADCIVPIEHCLAEAHRVLVLRPSEPGRYVRPKGEDLRAGETLVAAGRRLLGPELGLLAADGRASAIVHPRPRVALLSTGDELVEAGAEARYGQVHDANSFTLHGAVSEAGGVPVSIGIIGDDPGSLRDAVGSSANQADVLVVSGGVSVGERDPVRGAFFESASVDFYRVAMQPGMPQAFGMVDGRPFFGLPGNPVSVFVSFEAFVRPVLLKMMGRSSLFRPEVTARLDTEIPRVKDKTRFARVFVRHGPDGWRAASSGSPGSNLLATVSRANGLALIPAGVGKLGVGDACRVMLFRNSED